MKDLFQEDLRWGQVDRMEAKPIDNLEHGGGLAMGVKTLKLYTSFHAWDPLTIIMPIV